MSFPLTPAETGSFPWSSYDLVLTVLATLGSTARSEALAAWLESATGGRSWLAVPVILVGSYLLARLVQWWSRRRLAGSEERATTSFGRAVFEEIHAPLAATIALFGVYLSLVVIDLVVLDLVESSAVLVGVVSTALVVLWARASVRIGGRWIEYVNETGVEYEFAPIFKNLWTIAIVVGAGLLVVSIWELELTPFLASAGILGIVLGFAAQDAIGNLIGGVALYFDNTYKIGDVIRIDDEMRGTVTDVGIRSTTVLTEDNLLVTVPNAVLNSTQVVNESAPQRHMRLRIPITAAYGTDYHEVEELVIEVARECPLVRDSPAPKLLFSEFGDSALVFELRLYINHPLVEKRAVDQINRGVYDAFDEAGITIPFPQRELSFLDDGTEHRFDDRLSAADPASTADGTPPTADGTSPADDRTPSAVDSSDAPDAPRDDSG
ncbi:mechanosensitive ion channel family protein [Natronobeatus ordinarius]|uniref:mechanosensitive ion channel family protein n=1 Tax=Natronobeatus ordinarius TaxID=2963433 RepID=UPI0020CF271B|nr:mechanosensitive ion channel domain-containing protein [Natronobeatus ordinarius]